MPLTAEIRRKRLLDIFSEVLKERTRQDKQWGGPDHDAKHVRQDWLEFIEKQTNRAMVAAPEVYRDRLIKIAALAFAALEALDAGGSHARK